MAKHLTKALGLLFIMGVICAQPFDRKVVQPGEDVQLSCWFPVSSGGLFQFIRQKVVISVFGNSTTTLNFVISNNKVIIPDITRETNRYSILERSNNYVLRIRNAQPLDSAFYRCRNTMNGIPQTTNIAELLVRGPLRDLYWIRDYNGRLTMDPPGRMRDGETRTISNTDNAVLCVVEVTNVQPDVTISIGRPGLSGSIDITDQFQTRLAVRSRNTNVGYEYSATVFFEKISKFSQSAIRNLYCSASQPGSRTLQKSINVQILSAPRSQECESGPFEAAVGTRGFQLTCLIAAHPTPTATWETPDGAAVRSTTNHPRYTVTNQEKFEGLLTTLTIKEVTRGSIGTYSVQASNSQGRGTLTARLLQSRVVTTTTTTAMVPSVPSVLIDEVGVDANLVRTDPPGKKNGGGLHSASNRGLVMLVVLTAVFSHFRQL